MCGGFGERAGPAERSALGACVATIDPIRGLRPYPGHTSASNRRFGCTGVSYADYGYSAAGASGTAEQIYTAVERLLELNVAKNSKLLDLGCGNGYFARRLAERGFRAQGVDLSASGILLAAKSHPEVPFFLGSAGELLESDPSLFDVVVSVEVIEHCPSTQAFCAELAACLRPGGSAILSTPYHGYLKNLLIALLGRSDQHYNPLWDGGHLKFFSARTLSRALQDAGLQVRSIDYVGRVPLVAKSMLVHAIKPA